MISIDEAMPGILTDEVPAGEQKPTEELRAEHIADAILKSVISNRDFIYAVRDVRYNPKNQAILVILYPAANKQVSQIIRRIEPVLGVREVHDNVLTDDESDKQFHVLKVLVSTKEEEKQDKKDDDGTTGQGGAKQVGLVQSYEQLMKQKSSEFGQE